MINDSRLHASVLALGLALTGSPARAQVAKRDAAVTKLALRTCGDTDAAGAWMVTVEDLSFGDAALASYGRTEPSSAWLHADGGKVKVRYDGKDVAVAAFDPAILRTCARWDGRVEAVPFTALPGVRIRVATELRNYPRVSMKEKDVDLGHASSGGENYMVLPAIAVSRECSRQTTITITGPDGVSVTIPQYAAVFRCDSSGKRIPDQNE